MVFFVFILVYFLTDSVPLASIAVCIAIICAFIKDNTEATERLQQQLWEQRPRENVADYRDYFCRND